jgi:hypothetical protein
MDATDIAIFIGCIVLIVSGILKPSGNTQTRFRALFSFISGGGLLILLAPYLIHEAATKHLPWSVPIIVIPISAVLSYGAYKLFWSHIVGRIAASPPQDDNITSQN